MRLTVRSTFALLLVFVMVLAACQPATPAPTVTVRPTATEPEPTAVVEVTDEATEEAVVEATEVVVDQATEEATEAVAEATEVAAEGTEVAMAEATEEAIPSFDVVEVTDEATEEATVEATEEPTEEATVAPTEVPTEEPTVAPTEVPTEEPTVAPTDVPTVEPTVEPTVVVEVTDEATEEAVVVEATEEAVAEATAEATEAAEVSLEANEDLSIAEILTQGEDFTTLLAAVDAAGLTEALSGEGPLTVFAPTDEAFATLLEAAEMSAEDMLAREDLANILLYHVVAGVIPADSLVTLIERQDDSELRVESLLEDQFLLFTVVDGSVVINGTVKVTITDVRASNGVIHVIDAVLMPEASE